MKKSKKIVLIIVGVLLLITLVIGSSYAYWKATKTQGDENTLTAACLDIDLTSITSGINLNNQFPITEEEGRATEGYTFKITNKCDTYVSYDINLESLNSVSESNRLNLTYLDTILDDGNVLDLGSYPTTENKSSAYDTRRLTTDTIGPKDSATSTKEYTLRVWLDEDAAEESMNKTWKGKITISASPVIAENAVTKLTKLAQTNTTELFTDDTEDANIRYMGANPSNYVDLGDGYYSEDLYYGYNSTDDHSFVVYYPSLEACQTGVLVTNGAYKGQYQFNTDCEKIHSKGEPILWRVIGVMNNIDDGTGNKETRLKVIRDEDIGAIAWDDKCTSFNETTGQCSNYTFSNNWETASLNKTLNEAFYNSTKTTELNVTENFYDEWKYLNFSNSGIKTKSHSLIGDAVYHLGGPDDNDMYIATTKDYYEIERSDKVYEGNPTSWTGKVGLMYPSDFGFATSGGEITDKQTCAAYELNTWWLGDDCVDNNWLKAIAGYDFWVISPMEAFKLSGIAISYYGFVEPGAYTNAPFYARPVVYLKSDVKIIGGNGTKESPYKLGL